MQSDPLSPARGLHPRFHDARSHLEQLADNRLNHVRILNCSLNQNKHQSAWHQNYLPIYHHEIKVDFVKMYFIYILGMLPIRHHPPMGQWSKSQTAGAGVAGAERGRRPSM